MHPTHYAIKSELVKLARAAGIRKTARLAKVSAMLVSRFCDGSGAHEAELLFLLADVFRRHLVMKPGRTRLRPPPALRKPPAKR